MSEVEPTVATQEPVAPAPDTAKGEEVIQPVEKTFTQKELDDILEKRLARERAKRETLTQERDVFRRMVIDRSQPPAPEPKKEQPTKPQREAFQDYETYIEALSDWKADQRFDQRETEREAKARETRQREAWEQQSRTHAEREAKAREKFEDYDSVSRDPTLPVSQAMAETIRASDMGPEVVMFLHANRSEAQRIASLAPLLAVKEIGKIEAQLALSDKPEAKPSPAAPQKPVRVSKAPEPIEPVTGSGSGSSAEPKDNDPIDVWVKKRNAQEKARRA